MTFPRAISAMLLARSPNDSLVYRLADGLMRKKRRYERV
jgi:hypothetical protein